MSTYTPVASQTLSASASSVTFSNIPQDYTDLILVFSGSASTSDDFQIQVNSDTGSNYSRTWLTGNGSTAASSRGTSQSYMRVDQNGYLSTGISNIIIHFMNYSNTTTYKTLLTRANNANNGVNAEVNLWRSTAAITSISINSLKAGTTFNLYGIL